MTTRDPFRVRCGACAHEWTAAWLPMQLDTVARLFAGLACPMCGADAHRISPASDEEPAPAEEEVD